LSVDAEGDPAGAPHLDQRELRHVGLGDRTLHEGDVP